MEKVGMSENQERLFSGGQWIEVDKTDEESRERVDTLKSRFNAQKLGGVILESIEKDGEIEKAAELPEGLRRLRDQWGMESEDKDKGLLEFERKVSWEEFQKENDKIGEAGQKSDDAWKQAVLSWEADVLSRDGIDKDNIVRDRRALEKHIKRYNRLSRFGEKEGRDRHFYGDMRLDDLVSGLLSDKILDGTTTGLMTREWRDGFVVDPRLMHLSYDEFDESGRKVSGLEQDRVRDDDQSVTVVFDGMIVDESGQILEKSGFDAAARYPTLSKLSRLNEKVTALIAKDDDTYGELQQIKAVEGIPIFTEEEWLAGGEDLMNKLDDERKVRSEEFYRRLEESRRKKEEAKVARGAELYKEVFGEVDEDAVNELIQSYAEKIDARRLADVYAEMKANREAGAMKMVEYMTEILELQDRPLIHYRDDMDYDTLGSCQRHFLGDIISINEKRATLYNVGRQIGTIAHECWHSYQHMMSDVEEGIVWQERQDRRELYNYNFKNYMTSDLDDEAYRGQLVEVEARAFDAAVREKLREFEPPKEEMERKVFTDVNKQEVDRVVGEALDRVKIEDILELAGKTSVKEFLAGSAGEVVPVLVEYLNKALGMVRPVTVGVDGVEGLAVFMDRRDYTLTVGENFMDKPLSWIDLWSLACQFWEQSRYDFLKREPYDERGELYQYNFDNHAYGRRTQLLDIESVQFADLFRDKVRALRKKQEGGGLRRMIGKVREKFGGR